MLFSHLQEFHLTSEYFRMPAEHNCLKELLKGALMDSSIRAGKPLFLVNRARHEHSAMDFAYGVTQ